MAGSVQGAGSRTVTERPSEDELIGRFFAPLAGEGAFGLRDDAAVVCPNPGHDLVVTVDAVVAGVHFFADDPPRSIAAKALAVNLSDLAAKGAAPLGFVLALALPSDWTMGWLEHFATGLGTAAASAGCALLGGDTVRTPGPLTVSITVFGSVPEGRMVRRTGALAADRLYVSGSIGDAAFGLRLCSGAWAPAEMSAAHREDLIDRYRHPQPRLALAHVLQAHANGAMDISDGLIGDAAKMMAASGTAGQIDLRAMPLSEAARALIAADPDALLAAATGGDDYEILAAVPPARCVAFEAAALAAGVRVTAIGEVTDGPPGLTVLGSAGHAISVAQGSFSHF